MTHADDPTQPPIGRPAPEGDAATARLCDADAAVLDAILEARAAGLDRGPLPPAPGTTSSAGRAEKMAALLGLLDRDAPDEPDAADLDDLTARTLAAVAEDRQRQRFARQVHVFAEPRQTTGVAWRQVMTAAAVFLIGFSLLLPVIDRSRDDAQRRACASGLAGMGGAFGRYAADHDGQLPRRGETAPDAAWWRVGQDPGQSNSAHLFILVRQRYVTPDQLACSANEHAPAAGALTDRHHDFRNYAEVSYSYQNQFRLQPISLDGGAIALLADKNPLFEINDGFSQRSDVAVNTPSVVHGSRGQNVLLNDGHVQWMTRPALDLGDRPADNLWTITGVKQHVGNETVRSRSENFLAP